MSFLLGIPGQLKTVLDRLTATRAANLDKLDANITTRAPASTALSNTVWTSVKAAFLDVAVSSRASGADLATLEANIVTALGDGSVQVIKSRQIVYLPNPTNVTISSVDVNKTLVTTVSSFSGSSTVGGQNIDGVHVWLANSTTVTAAYNFQTSGNSPVQYVTVLEFY